MFSDPASRCVQSQGNQERPDDSDRRAGQTAVRTSATKKVVRAEEEVSARLSDQPPCRKWKARRFSSCDRKSGTSWDAPFRGLRQPPVSQIGPCAARQRKGTPRADPCGALHYLALPFHW